MKLSFKFFDGRSSNHIDVLDEDSGRKVGIIKSRWNIPSIEISLFDRKYEATVSTYDECKGFVRGVQTVLSRMTSTDDGRRRLEHELDKLKEEGSSSNWPPAKVSSS